MTWCIQWYIVSSITSRLARTEDASCHASSVLFLTNNFTTKLAVFTHTKSSLHDTTDDVIKFLYQPFCICTFIQLPSLRNILNSLIKVCHFGLFLRLFFQKLLSKKMKCNHLNDCKRWFLFGVFWKAQEIVFYKSGIHFLLF